MNPEIITETDLMEVAQVKSRAALRQWLEQHSIRYFTGRNGRISTTRYYLNHPDDGRDAVGFA